MLYAIGDIHGCARELELLLQQIKPKADDTVVFLGDYIDRGPDSKGVIDLILDLQEKTNVVALKGNHEQLFLDFLESPESPGAGVFVLNGGGATLASYPGPGGTFEIPERHVEFFYGLKLKYETPSHFFVHAGVPLKPLDEITDADSDALLWSRQPFLSSNYEWSKIVVHGHTPVAAPDIKDNRINLDTGCVYGGHLTALELPTGKIFQVAREKASARVQVHAPVDENRVAVRFTGRLPVYVKAQGDASASRVFETLNYNQFGVLMREAGPASSVPLLAKDQKIAGTIGPGGAGLIQFEGVVVRVESRNGMRLYGVSLTRVTNGNEGREWIERPAAPAKGKT
jgi:serine/threonine protein phosphatase 1